LWRILSLLLMQVGGRKGRQWGSSTGKRHTNRVRKGTVANKGRERMWASKAKSRVSAIVLPVALINLWGIKAGVLPAEGGEKKRALRSIYGGAI